MTEKIRDNSNIVSAEQLAHAQAFLDEHVYTEKPEEDYRRDTFREWLQSYQENHRPLWQRRTFEMGSEFGAVIDYGIFAPDREPRVFASIVLDNDTVDIWLPRGEGASNPTEPYTAFSRPYSVESVALALAEVNQTIQTPN